MDLFVNIHPTPHVNCNYPSATQQTSRHHPMNALVYYAVWALAPTVAVRIMMRIYMAILGTNMSPRAVTICRVIVATAVFAIPAVHTIGSVNSSSTNPTLYDRLGIQCDASSYDVSRSFRKWARIHHPDKAPSSASAAYMDSFSPSSSSSSSQSDDFYHTLTMARDILSDSARRFAYDREQTVLDDKTATAHIPPTALSVVSRLALSSFISFIISSLVLFLTWMSGFRDFMPLRILLCLCQLAIEFTLYTSSTACWPGVGPTFILIQVLRSIMPRLSLYVAQLGSIFRKPEFSVSDESARVNFLAKLLVNEISLDLNSETSPFSQPEQRQALKSLVVEKIIDYDVYSREEVAAAPTKR